MTVRSILNTKGHQITSVEPDVKLSAAIKLLGEKKIGAVLVMNQSRLEGILSERDIVRVLGERGAGVLEEPVSEVMTRKVVTCKETDTGGRAHGDDDNRQVSPSARDRERQGGRPDLDRRHRQAPRPGI
ncbi:CBS-domain-containing membrane protein [Bradyrhizobium sp. USDA 4354]